MDEIESVPQSSQDEAIRNIKGINVYDTNILKQGVVQKINKDLKEKEIAISAQKVDKLLKEIRDLKSSIQRNDKARALISNKSYSEVTLLKLKTLKSQHEKDEHQLKITKAKLIKAQYLLRVQTYEASKTQPDASTVDEIDDVLPTFSGNYDDKAVSSAKTIKDRKNLIRQGLATPFAFEKQTKKAVTLKFDNTFGNSLVCPTGDKPANKKNEKVNVRQENKLKRASPPALVSVPISEKRKKVSEDDDFILGSNDLDLCDVDEMSAEEVEDGEPNKRFTANMAKKRVVIDDANPRNYKKRITRYKQQLLKDASEGYENPDDKLFDGGLKVPGKIWERLYKYQQTGVKWLWELHTQQTGGILGDEMGLGKTIQVIAFLAALHNSKIRDRDSSYSYDGLGPVLIVTPATVMHQWVKELHAWAPFLRVAILHSSGTHKGSQVDLINNMVLSRGVLVTSYERVRLALDDLLAKGWHYLILDEGHKIRNPEAGVTHAVKLFSTPHRIILSGSPIQNHLRELWSLFDFVFPGKLGTLPVFMEQFSVPIVQGGYANASEVEVQTAYKCACMLRSTIAPYLLRRMKQDVQYHIKLPEKSDQVLFCSLTDHQVEVYQNYLNSDAVHSILHGNLKVFVGLIQLRKICNHPDLYTGGHKLLVGEETPSYHDERRFGFWKRSGKMIVVESLLRIWKKQGKKVLLFTQSKLMLDVLEDFVKSRNYTYLVMHGGSSIATRQPMIKKFNEDPDIFVFILTTRVGGLGVNLIGADRVVIYDPDWNPSTDMQAQERAWRIGQKKQVTIYRLLTTGTIEEKIYHRQIFKQFMSNRVLKDPKQRRFFKSNDMHELFMLNHQEKDAKKTKTETASIFAGTGSEINLSSIQKKHKTNSSQCAALKINEPPMQVATSHKDTSLNDNDKPLIPMSISNMQDAISDPVVATESLTYIKKTATEMNTSVTLPQIEANTAKDDSETLAAKAILDDNNTWQFTTSRRSSDTLHATSTSSCEDTPSPSAINSQVEPCCSYTTHTVTAADDNAKPTSAVKPNSSTMSQLNQTNKNLEDGSNAATNSKSAKIKESFLQALKKFKNSRSETTVKSPKRKRTKTKQRNDVDGEVVENVLRKSKYKQQNKEDLNKADDYVLAKLFNKGVHSAMKHNTIMSSGIADYALVESEANRVAKEAVKNLRRSRQHYKFPQMGRTRTKPKFGKIAVKKKVTKKRRDSTSSSDEEAGNNNTSLSNSGPMPSSQLLMQMRRRNHIEKPSQEISDEEDDVTSDSIKGAQLTEDYKLLASITEFISSKMGGEASTSELMMEFDGKIKTEQAPYFKSMLHQICVSRKGYNDELKWMLKPEFQ